MENTFALPNTPPLGLSFLLAYKMSVRASFYRLQLFYFSQNEQSFPLSHILIDSSVLTPLCLIPRQTPFACEVTEKNIFFQVKAVKADSVPSPGFSQETSKSPSNNGSC